MRGLREQLRASYRGLSDRARADLIEFGTILANFLKFLAGHLG